LVTISFISLNGGLRSTLPSIDETRVYRKGDYKAWSNVAEYGETGRTPTNAPELGDARKASDVTFGFDRYGNVQGADKDEAFKLSTEIKEGDYLSIINDINQNSSLVLNGRTRIEEDDDGNEFTVIDQATLGVGDDLAIVVDANGPRYAYNGETFISMEDGTEYYANDGAAARWDAKQRQLQVRQEEYQLALRYNEDHDTLALSGRMTNDNDGQGLGVLGITTAEGEQFEGRTNAEIADYAKTYATVDADRPFSAAVRDHSARFNNSVESGDDIAGVDFEGVYSPEFYEQAAKWSRDNSRTLAPRDR